MISQQMPNILWAESDFPWLTPNNEADRNLYFWDKLRLGQKRNKKIEQNSNKCNDEHLPISTSDHHKNKRNQRELLTWKNLNL